MNRYPSWAYALIALVIALAITYTAPNLPVFGESPAIQISPARATATVDTALLTRVQNALLNVNIQTQGAVLTPEGIKLRFADTDTQARAQDTLHASLGDDYVVALNLLPNTPDWMASIGALPMYLGLDLRGGVHFVLQVDMQAALEKKLDGLAGYARNDLRDKHIAYAGIARDGQTLILHFRDTATRASALAALTTDTPELAYQPSEAPGDFLLIGTLKPDEQTKTQELALQQNITTLRNRVNELGVAEPIVQQEGADRIVVQLPGVQDTARAKEIIGRTATLEVRMVEAQASDPAGRDYDPQKITSAIRGDVPFGTELFYAPQRDGGREPLLLNRVPMLTGERFTNAQPGFDSQTQQPIVSVELDGQGARIMTDVTRDAVKRRMAILLVEKGKPEVITAPVINEPLGGRFQITGSRNAREASDLALLIRAGALAAPMQIIEERTVGPSLGADNIKIGFHSTWLGFTLVAAFMIAYYLAFGFISIVALACNLLFLVALLSYLQATLTLPGMAGIALTLGMAIDANVLINERIREELRNGTPPQAAIHAGYDRAWGTIFDSNITTLIAGMALFALGSGPVKGFAVVLCLGIVTSIFSSVIVSRALVNFWYGRRRRLDKISIGQIWRPTPAVNNAKGNAKGSSSAKAPKR